MSTYEEDSDAPGTDGGNGDPDSYPERFDGEYALVEEQNGYFHRRQVELGQ